MTLDDGKGLYVVACIERLAARAEILRCDNPSLESLMLRALAGMGIKVVTKTTKVPVTDSEWRQIERYTYERDI
jgi:hypothetical protein